MLQAGMDIDRRQRRRWHRRQVPHRSVAADVSRIWERSVASRWRPAANRDGSRSGADRHIGAFLVSDQVHADKAFRAPVSALLESTLAFGPPQGQGPNPTRVVLVHPIVAVDDRALLPAVELVVHPVPRNRFDPPPLLAMKIRVFVPTG